MELFFLLKIYFNQMMYNVAGKFPGSLVVKNTILGLNVEVACQVYLLWQQIPTHGKLALILDMSVGVI